VTLPPYLIPVLLMLGGSGGLLWGALNWRRDDTTKQIAQTDAIVTMLRGLIDELEAALQRAELDGQRTKEQLLAERREVARLRVMLDDANTRLAALERERDMRKGRPARD
jgi:septal ring factor EnvC (AmiA/AmiB activator)